MLNRVEQIRADEKRYHDFIYEHHVLFEEGSWLHKPVSMIQGTLPSLLDIPNVRVLDLGCGVGRNSIPIASEIQKNHGKVVCVDLLDSALTKLERYSQTYGIEHAIQPVKSDIAAYSFPENHFQWIVAISALEHVSSVQALTGVLEKMKRATKEGGVHSLIVNSNVEERCVETNQRIEASIEVNLPTKNMENLLNKTYRNWNVLTQTVKPLSFNILREQKEVRLTTNAITLVVKNERPQGDGWHE
ncbi:class I SAM-dependent methyltransferase [Alkalihalobacillus sp. LMS6]|uniref:class I SAM-dependent methyltransferase n=1 Tax=Alkalihalobacillus sp. LMS6 TaxID=2924034 RepID=UPI0034E960C2